MTDPSSVEMPPRIAALRRCPRRNIPAPWFVAWINGEPDFRVIGPDKIVDAIRFDRCWICGQQRGRASSFVIGPMCAINRVSAEPPCHRDCAIYAAKVCPFLTNPKQRRRTNDLPEQYEEPAGEMICRNPGVSLIWTTRKWSVFTPPGGGVLFNVGEPTETLWLTQGRTATHDEVMASIESGLPILRNIATEEGVEAIALLEEMRVKALTYVPV